MREGKYVVFQLDDGEYGMDIMGVKEIIRYEKTVYLPDSPRFLEGVINYRDSTVPVVHLAKRLGLQDRGLDDNSRIIIASIGDRNVGFLVEEVKEVINIRHDIIDRIPEIAAPIDRQYILGVARINGRLIILLDINEILSGTEKEKLDNIS